jgi:hypothetical protein
MELMAFQKLRGGLTMNVSPASGIELEAAESRLRTLLTSSAMFGHVEVDKTGEADHLLVAMVYYRPELCEQDIVNYLEKLWVGELRYLGWDAHSFLVEDGQVELQAATMHGDASHYVTLHVMARAGIPADAAIPTQRASDPAKPVLARLRRRLRKLGV